MREPFINPLARRGSSIVDSARALKSLTRGILALADDVVVSVSELACHVPGCPPRETVILVMQGVETLQISIHKPMADVTEDDLLEAFAGASGRFETDTM
ncbi:hypothetical protein [Pararhizobium antarcticum]|uniref:Nitrate reductase n=1 Tax=Pararhizobium antarcticum TaxID=1798805 RepID=A0A657LKM2_9HYPH|nr:hypothetical protein [Pararhizobium antarcticum]OJF89772.1 hypothetical protein AX761_07200 [Rhizobium sp. 58]OJF90201.1 hypothetical protein AX760_24470 [Pararhizobium antarcticum]